MIEHLAWDTAHFGVPIGRIAGSTVSAADVVEADQLGLRCLYLLVQATDSRAVGAAEALGFRLIDERVTLGRPLVGHEPSGLDDAGSAAVRRAVAADLGALESIALYGARRFAVLCRPALRPRGSGNAVRGLAAQ